jgi:uncharacterized protein YpmS
MDIWEIIAVSVFAIACLSVLIVIFIMCISKKTVPIKDKNTDDAAVVAANTTTINHFLN